MLKAQKLIEQKYAERLTVEQLTEEVHLTRRTFERRFEKATRNTVPEYIQRVKTEAAKKQLELGGKPISEIILDISYTDMQTFKKVFKSITGMTPIDYKNKYKKGKVV